MFTLLASDVDTEPVSNPFMTALFNIFSTYDIDDVSDAEIILSMADTSLMVTSVPSEEYAFALPPEAETSAMLVVKVSEPDLDSVIPIGDVDSTAATLVNSIADSGLNIADVSATKTDEVSCALKLTNGDLFSDMNMTLVSAVGMIFVVAVASDTEAEEVSVVDTVTAMFLVSVIDTAPVSEPGEDMLGDDDSVTDTAAASVAVWPTTPAVLSDILRAGASYAPAG